ncbi:MAG TPA: ankyrin repeat domain-containing protein [Candidatus Angelobacter sp.]|nr:ankyrin repeat domain-containing protein [Candidatus Angelobacter sp.]
MVAIWQADSDTVAKLLNSGMTVNSFIPLDCNDGNKPLLTTPLLNAIQAADSSHFRSRSPEMVEFLLNHGADPNFRPPEGLSPLQMAASEGEAPLSVTKLLLRHGARVDDRDDGGETALLIAAQRKNGPAVVQELAAAGADIHAVNEFGHNALMLAAWQHYKDTVILLAKIGVDACAIGKDGKTASDMAKTNLNDDLGKQEIISFLQEKCGR